jgi:hypothetical protein
VLGANSPFAGLKITVNQTQGLTNQAISITWTGGTPTNADTGGFSGQYLDNFLQIFQCWGDPDTTNPNNPGPPPQQCEFGAQPPVDPVAGTLPILGVTDDYTRQLQNHAPDWVPSPSDGVYDAGGGNYWMPFRAVDGTVVNIQDNAAVVDNPQAGQFWLNPYFDYTTTNEEDFARTFPDGTGSEVFSADTGLEAPGLGCGQHSLIQPGGTATVPQCWLVIVPRESRSAENIDQCSVTDCPGVDTSPMLPSVWQNRIAVPLQFRPVDESCSIGGNERRIAGSELATAAVTSWQPTLCNHPGSPPYQYSSLSDDQARQQLLGTLPGEPGAVVISRPIDPTTVDPTDPPVYAPLTLSGLVIGFNIERIPINSGSQGYDPAEQPLAGIPVGHIYLTPRLVAKLLTESYKDQFDGENFLEKTNGYTWLQHNAISLISDPDFLQYNPEFAALTTRQYYEAGGLIVEQPTADSAYEVWQWILSDREAGAWLEGQPDQWGMQVNPYYATNPDVNPSGVAFANPSPNNYPKADPYEYQQPNVLTSGVLPRPLTMQDVLPYTNNVQVAAADTSAASDGATRQSNPAALTPDTAWGKVPKQNPGTTFMISITDSASATTYGLQTASLSRAGDDGSSRTFIVPTQGSILAGAQAMVPSSVNGVLLPNPSPQSASAYPLTALTYAAITPGALSASERVDYANFIAYGAGPGQIPGTAFGQLPPGYVPLPGPLQAQAEAAARTIANFHSATAPGSNNPSSTTSSPAQGSGTGAATGAGSGGGSSGVGTTPNSASVGSGSPSGLGPGSGAGKPESNLALAGSVTPKSGVGAIRYVLPIVLGLGILAGLAARWLGVRRPTPPNTASES